jgi:hypothetical protein
LIIILSSFLLVKNIIIFKRKASINQDVLCLQRDWKVRLVLIIILSFLYTFFVNYIGFLLSIFIFQLLLLIILKVKKILVLFLFPFIMTSVFYFIFIRALHIPFQRGSGVFITISRLFY